MQAFDRPGGVLLAEQTVTAQLLTSGTVTVDGFFAHISVRAHPDGDDQRDVPASWSMSGSAAGAGGSASANVSATYAEQGGRPRTPARGGCRRAPAPTRSAPPPGSTTRST